jgi:hypothetical protein
MEPHEQNKMEHQLKILFPSSLQSSATFQHKKVVCISVLQKMAVGVKEINISLVLINPHG